MAPIWAARFGPSRPRRLGLAFLAGILVIAGAALVKGRPAIFGLVGGLEPALGALAFLLAMFASGITVAMLLYRPWEARERREASRV